MSQELELNFLDIFQGIDDPRSERNRLYTMSEILLVTLSASICGAEGWQDVEDFGKSKLDYLKSFLPYHNGIPSDDTLRRFFRSLDPEKFQELVKPRIKPVFIFLFNNIRVYYVCLLVHVCTIHYGQIPHKCNLFCQ